MGKAEKYAKFVCIKEECEFEGTKKDSIHHVILQHAPLEAVPYYCSLCNYRCFNFRSLKSHVQKWREHKQLSNGSDAHDVDSLCKSETPFNVKWGPSDDGNVDLIVVQSSRGDDSNSTSQNNESETDASVPRFHPLQLGNTRYIDELNLALANNQPVTQAKVESHDVPVQSENLTSLGHQNSVSNSSQNAGDIMELLMTSQYILAQAAHSLVEQEEETESKVKKTQSGGRKKRNNEPVRQQRLSDVYRNLEQRQKEKFSPKTSYRQKNLSSYNEDCLSHHRGDRLNRRSHDIGDKRDRRSYDRDEKADRKSQYRDAKWERRSPERIETKYRRSHHRSRSISRDGSPIRDKSRNTSKRSYDRYDGKNDEIHDRYSEHREHTHYEEICQDDYDRHSRKNAHHRVYEKGDNWEEQYEDKDQYAEEKYLEEYSRYDRDGLNSRNKDFEHNLDIGDIKEDFYGSDCERRNIRGHKYDRREERRENYDTRLRKDTRESYLDLNERNNDPRENTQIRRENKRRSMERYKEEELFSDGGYSENYSSSKRKRYRSRSRSGSRSRRTPQKKFRSSSKERLRGSSSLRSKFDDPEGFSDTDSIYDDIEDEIPSWLKCSPSDVQFKKDHKLSKDTTLVFACIGGRNLHFGLDCDEYHLVPRATLSQLTQEALERVKSIHGHKTVYFVVGVPDFMGTIASHDYEETVFENQNHHDVFYNQMKKTEQILQRENSHAIFCTISPMNLREYNLNSQNLGKTNGLRYEKKYEKMQEDLHDLLKEINRTIIKVNTRQKFLTPCFHSGLIKRSSTKNKIVYRLNKFLDGLNPKGTVIDSWRNILNKSILRNKVLMSKRDF